MAGQPFPILSGGALFSVSTALAYASGTRDEVKLTDLTFAARHPELPAGYTLRKEDTPLVQDWLRIRDHPIRPLLSARF
jgi:hypothetical protein